MVRVPLFNATKTHKLTEAEKLYAASQWQLMWRKFKDHKLAMIALFILGVLYTIAFLAPFLAPAERNSVSGSM